MKKRKPRYQQGSITRVKRSKGYAWEVRFSEYKNGKRHQRTLTFDGGQYPTEKHVRKAIELTISHLNAGTPGEKADATFGAVTGLYRTEHLPTLDVSTRSTNGYLLRDYIETRFSQTPIREMRPLLINDWIQTLPLSPSAKRNVRSIMSVCFRLAALHEYTPPMQQNPMTLIKLKGATKRKKNIQELTVSDFKRLLERLPQPLNIMVLVAGAYGLRVSELVALKWEDIDAERETVSIVRKFTRGQLGDTKTAASNAPLPISRSMLRILLDWKPKTCGSEWLFPSSRTGGPRSASMLLQKTLKPIAEELGLGAIGFHSLRHACRSWLSSIGTDMSTTKGLMRHADISTTMNIYGSSLTDDMREAHDRLVRKLID